MVPSSSLLALLLAGALAMGGIRASAQPPCGPEVSVQVQAAPLGNYTYQLNATVEPAGSLVTYASWSYAYPGNSGLWTSPICYLPGPGNYLVGGSCTVEDELQNTCATVGMVLLQVPPDTIGCGALTADFHVSYDNGVFSFVPAGGISTGITTYLWSFGDESTVSQAMPQHTFLEEGHYQVCLTVSQGDCSLTHCRWLYFGSGGVTCEEVLVPDISFIVLDRTVACINESLTHGMNSSATWDFGDGTTSSGQAVVHTYAEDHFGPICARISSWGPLLEDTCEVELCEFPPFPQVVGMNENGADPLRIHPVPFQDRFTVGHPDLRVGAPWALMDLTGRTVLEGTVPQLGTFTVNTATLPSGAYLFRLGLAGQSVTRRVLKH